MSSEFRDIDESPKPMDTRTHVLLMAVRQALLIALGALEDYLRLDRSVTPKHLR
jgi:hypothetical protein